MASKQLKTRTVTLKEVLQWFGPLVVAISRRYETFYYPAEDICQDLLILISQHEWSVEPTRCAVTGEMRPINPAHVNRFLRSRALDVVRAQRSRQKAIMFGSIPDEHAYEVKDSEPAPLLERLREELTEKEFEIILVKAAQPPRLVHIARRDQRQGLARRAAGQKVMNIRNLRVMDRHVAEYCGVSGATVSRTLNKAREILRNCHAESEDVGGTSGRSDGRNTSSVLCGA